MLGNKREKLKILSGLMGLCVGDALGVPVEFTYRKEQTRNPVTTMTGYGTHNQPPGTWSDDSSLTFCLAEAICITRKTPKLIEITAQNFCLWYDESYWTPHGEVFDIGFTTSQAIFNLKQGISPTEAGAKSERNNGNGSLMRILPLAFCYSLIPFYELINLTHQISCITHGHLRSQIACGIYISIVISLLEGNSPNEAYLEGIEKVRKIYQQPPFALEMHHFQIIMAGKIADLTIDEIESSGYVVATLEAALWCFPEGVTTQLKA